MTDSHERRESPEVREARRWFATTLMDRTPDGFRKARHHAKTLFDALDAADAREAGLREVLKFYADKKNWWYDFEEFITGGPGPECARAALSTDGSEVLERLKEHANSYSPRHSHEPEIPPTLDDEGRCSVCAILVERDVLRAERTQMLAALREAYATLHGTLHGFRRIVNPTLVRHGEPPLELPLEEISKRLASIRAIPGVLPDEQGEKK